MPSQTEEVVTQFSITAASEQPKESKSEVVEKVIPVADVWMSADDMCQKL